MGWTNGDNKFGPTKFVVGPVLGDGVNYTSIQTAINDAGAGPVDIYIRPSTYTENLSFNGNVYLIATDMSGTLSPPVLNSAHVNIIGDHTVNQNGLTVCQGIFFNNVVTGFTLEDTATAGVAKLECLNCFFNSAGVGFSLGGATGNGQLRLVNCQVQSVGRCIVVPTGSTGGFYELLNTTLQSSADGCVFIDSGVCQGIVNSCVLDGSAASPFTFNNNSSGASLDLRNSKLSAPSVACITFQSNAVVTASHNTYDTGGNSEYITGPGVYNYGAEVIIPTQGFGIDNAATQTKYTMRPFAETGSGLATDVRGTANFDASFFTATDGYITYGGSIGHAPIYELDADSGSAVGIQVNVLGKAGCTTEASASTLDIYAIKWIDVAAVGGAVADIGHFITATHTRTLPAAPIQGTVCAFCVKGAAAVLTIQAPGTALIRIGSSVSSAGGTCTSIARGDAIRLVYSLSDDTWYSEQGPQGNWTLA